MSDLLTRADFLRVEETVLNGPDLKEMKHPPKRQKLRGTVTVQMKPLKVLKRAGLALVEDIDSFIATGLTESKSTKTTIYFVRAAYFYACCLIIAPFNRIKDITSDATGVEYQDFTTQVSDTETVINKVEDGLGRLALATERWGLDTQSFRNPTSVPTASPYQLLFEALLESEEVVQKLQDSQDDADLLRNIRLLFPGVHFPAQSQDRQELGDGRPVTVFASVYHKDDGTKRFLFGCSKPDWTGFEAIAVLTKDLRDTRLKECLPLSEPAFKALKAMEKRLEDEAAANNQGQPNHSSLSPEQRKEDERAALQSLREAVGEAMREDETFLWTDQVGMAFSTPSWTHKPACYVCASTMGYQDPGAETNGNSEARFSTHQ
ncbi:uncharacterized protein B0H64DRAFT_413452 [Chaetomium fimeti]|uniref:Uncharacterized protein n=1 Tax=Chaetomium fimeti TaxID=1854472 RepID=A0AAE0LLZ2_9PEZI|nr:hypothetical protein B0H64DRAFT_413452 [Chaetomium fimeti]